MSEAPEVSSHCLGFYDFDGKLDGWYKMGLSIQELRRKSQHWLNSLGSPIHNNFRPIVLVLLLVGTAGALFQYDKTRQMRVARNGWLQSSMMQMTQILMSDQASAQQELFTQAWALSTLDQIQGAERGALILFLARLELFPSLSLATAQLQQADLRQINLQNTDLQQVDLSRADLRFADLTQANLAQAVLVDANLTGAELAGATLTLAYAQGSNFSGVNASEADLTEADLSLANLYGSYFPYANLAQSFLESANLRRSNFQGANLEGASLKGSDLRQTDLREATLIGANLSDTNIEGTFWAGAIYDQTTIFPAWFIPEEWGLIPVEESD